MKNLLITKKNLLLSNKALLNYFIFIIAFAVVVVAFTTSTTYTQLALATLFYVLLVFATYKLLPKKIWRQSTKKITLAENETDHLERKGLAALGIADIDKRVFLTLIGSTGLFLFLFSLFNKKTESLLFKNLPVFKSTASPDKNGDTVEPTQNQPLDGYRISEIEDNVVSFYGFVKKDDSWYIMRVDTNTGSFRYVRGESDFSKAWTNRKKLQYDYFNNVF